MAYQAAKRRGENKKSQFDNEYEGAESPGALRRLGGKLGDLASENPVLFSLLMGGLAGGSAHAGFGRLARSTNAIGGVTPPGPPSPPGGWTPAGTQVMTKAASRGVLHDIFSEQAQDTHDNMVKLAMRASAIEFVDTLDSEELGLMVEAEQSELVKEAIFKTIAEVGRKAASALRATASQPYQLAANRGWEWGGRGLMDIAKRDAARAAQKLSTAQELAAKGGRMSALGGPMMQARGAKLTANAAKDTAKAELRAAKAQQHLGQGAAVLPTAEAQAAGYGAQEGSKKIWPWLVGGGVGLGIGAHMLKKKPEEQGMEEQGYGAAPVYKTAFLQKEAGPGTAIAKRLMRMLAGGGDDAAAALLKGKAAAAAAKAGTTSVAVNPINAAIKTNGAGVRMPFTRAGAGSSGANAGQGSVSAGIAQRNAARAEGTGFTQISTGRSPYTSTELARRGASDAAASPAKARAGSSGTPAGKAGSGSANNAAALQAQADAQAARVQQRVAELQKAKPQGGGAQARVQAGPNAPTRIMNPAQQQQQAMQQAQLNANRQAARGKPAGGATPNAPPGGWTPRGTQVMPGGGAKASPATGAPGTGKTNVVVNKANKNGPGTPPPTAPAGGGPAAATNDIYGPQGFDGFVGQFGANFKDSMSPTGAFRGVKDALGAVADWNGPANAAMRKANPAAFYGRLAGKAAPAAAYGGGAIIAGNAMFGDDNEKNSSYRDEAGEGMDSWASSAPTSRTTDEESNRRRKARGVLGASVVGAGLGAATGGADTMASHYVLGKARNLVGQVGPGGQAVADVLKALPYQKAQQAGAALQQSVPHLDGAFKTLLRGADKVHAHRMGKVLPKRLLLGAGIGAGVIGGGRALFNAATGRQSGSSEDDEHGAQGDMEKGAGFLMEKQAKAPPHPSDLVLRIPQKYKLPLLIAGGAFLAGRAYGGRRSAAQAAQEGQQGYSIPGGL
jgi:hypothetical protein